MNLTRWKSPPQYTGDNVADFRYPVLKSQKTGIRLVKLQPGVGNKAISIDLVESFVTGTGRTPYDALSYTWGGGTRDKNIFCNGKRLPVTRTLWEALNRFRSPNEEVTLWIDQICICQGRVKERNAQVEMMGDIFKSARKVTVWLGDDYDDSRAGMQLAQQLVYIALYQQISGLTPADLETHGLPKRGHRRWKALALILRRPWFWRTWIVQEVVLNPNVELVLGSNCLTWEELEKVVALLDGPLPRVWHLDQAMNALELPFSRINRIRLRHQRQIYTPTTPIQLDNNLVSEPESIDTEDSDNDSPDLLDLLLMSRDLGATDPRDKIYALLGLGKHEIYPDYSMSPESVFAEFALQTIGLVTSMAARRDAASLGLSSQDREVRRAMIILSCAGRMNQGLDWTTNLQSRPLIFGIGQRFSAGGSRLGLFDWQPDSGLQLCGKLFDTIYDVGTVKLDHESSNSPGTSHKLITKWWLETKRIAATRVATSPGSTTYTDAFEALRRRLFLCKHGYYIGENTSQSPRRRGSVLDEADLASNPGHNALQTLTLGPTRGRNMFVTGTGWLGLAPHGTQQGDVIFVVVGADVPFVLRQCGEAYEIIGEAYVEGIMHGEAMGMDWLGVEDIMIG
jgi:hypothetical protein